MRLKIASLAIAALLGIALAAGGARDARATAAKRASVAAGASAKAKPTVVRGLVVLGCRKYSYGRSRCYASRSKHPEVRMFYVFEGPKPKAGRIADVRGLKKGALIDTTPEAGVSAANRARLRGYARSTKVVGVVRSYNQRKRTLNFFVSLWSRCGSRTYYCMAQGKFKAGVPKRLSKKAKAAARAWARSRGKVWLMTLEFNRGKSVRLAAIKAVKDNRRRR